MNLPPEQLRVLGCLVEKDLTTPEYYPLTINSLTLACNQKSNREPLMSLTESEVSVALDSLRQAGLAVRSADSVRASKYAHNLRGKLTLDRGELALLGVLLLRGPQTLNELRTRSERMYPFGDSSELEATLDVLAQREPPLVAKLERQPGQKEPRFTHLCGAQARPEPATSERAPPERAPPDWTLPTAEVAPSETALAERVAQLESTVQSLSGEIAALRQQLERLQASLGE